MTLSITLSNEIEAKLRQKAAASGEPVDAYAAKVLERAITAPTVDELLAPFRQQVERSGMSDQELDEFFEDVREKAYQDRQRRPA